MGKIFCFMGKSAAGKDTIFKQVATDIPSLKKIVLSTTRPIRENEIDGVDYYFVSENEYLECKNNNLIIEERSYDTIHGIWRYFTSSNEINLENDNYITVNTLEGYKALKSYYGSDYIVPIYIELDDGIRLMRALEREIAQKEPKYKELCRRFISDSEDFSEENLESLNIDKRYNNTILDDCVKEIEEDIKLIINTKILTNEKK